MVTRRGKAIVRNAGESTRSQSNLKRVALKNKGGTSTKNSLIFLGLFENVISVLDWNPSQKNTSFREKTKSVLLMSIR